MEGAPRSPAPRIHLLVWIGTFPFSDISQYDQDGLRLARATGSFELSRGVLLGSERERESDRKRGRKWDANEEGLREDPLATLLSRRGDSHSAALRRGGSGKGEGTGKQRRETAYDMVSKPTPSTEVVRGYANTCESSPAPRACLPYPVASCRVVSHRFTSCNIVSCHGVSRCGMSCHVIS